MALPTLSVSPRWVFLRSVCGSVQRICPMTINMFTDPSAQALSVWDLCRVNKKWSTSLIKTCLHNPWCETLSDIPTIKTVKIFQHIYLLVSTFNHWFACKSNLIGPLIDLCLVTNLFFLGNLVTNLI